MRLRAETRETHERLDARFAHLAEPGGAAEYRRFVRVNAACLAALRPPLAASGLLDAAPAADPAERAAAGRADLAAMGLTPLAAPPFPLPAPTLAQAVGIAYVLEGSRLGARTILRALAARPPLETAAPVTTFLLEAAGRPERFRAFMGQADALAATDADITSAVGAADLTFRYFLDVVRAAEAADRDGETN